MKAKEFGTRTSNDFFRGGQRYSANGYNKSFKKERFPGVQEYANKDLDEYHRFEETKDFTKEPDLQKSDERQANQSKKSENANKMRQRMLQQAVGIVVGSTVVVTSYQAQVEERAKQQDLEPTAAVVETVDIPPIVEEDILDEVIIQEEDNNEQSAVAKNDSGRSRGTSGNGGRSGGRGTGNTSSNANADANTDIKDADEQKTDVSEIEDSENIDENTETVPDIQEYNQEDNQEDNTDNEYVADADEQDTTPLDDNSETDNSEIVIVIPSVEEVKNDTSVRHIATSPVWEWSSDKTNASYVIKASSGGVISSTPVTIISVEEPATCTEDGKITYTATINIDGKEYTDIKYEILNALGHLFGSGEEVTLEDGKKAIRFECTRCHEYFIIGNSIDEE